MKRSLGVKLTCIFLASLLGIISLAILINNVFLPEYYVKKSETKLITLYNDLNFAIDQDIFATEDFELELEKECQSWNISAFAVDTDGETAFSINSMEGILKGSLLNHLFNEGSQEIYVKKDPDEAEGPGEPPLPVDDPDSDDSKNSSNTIEKYGDSEKNNEKIVEERIFSKNDKMSKTVIKETEDYTLQRVNDFRMGSDYLEMWGTLSNGCEFILRTPLEGMALNAILANQFMVYVGIGVAIFGTLIILLVSHRISKPIKELTGLSVEMADLNFNKKYTGKRKDEIGVLGHNFNKMSESLENTISELKSANMRLEKDIENKNRLEEMRSDFIGNVSHELKTPIAIIQGYAEGLKDSIDDPGFDTELYCDVIIDETRKMNHMVKNLLSLNELEFGENMLDISRFDISDMITGIVQSNGNNLVQKEIIVDDQVKGPLFVWGDAFKIEEVLTNYFSNAIHHCEACGDYSKPVIRISTTQTDKLVRVCVFNSGKNIPEEDMERIWEKFYKVDKAHTREYGGNGIGLSIVKAIMDAHNKSFGAYNDEEGVAFWFELDPA